MLRIRSKRILFILFLSLITGLFSPVLTQADEVNTWGGDSGSIDAGKAAAQREASAKRAAKKQKKIEENKTTDVKKDTEVQKRETSGK